MVEGSPAWAARLDVRHRDGHWYAMNHKRRRGKAQRAGCYCGGKLAKALMKAIGRSGTGKVYGSRGSALRLRVRANDTE